MEISRSLYNDTLIRLGPIDYDNDAPLKSRWSHDATYLRLLAHFAFRELNLYRLSAAVPEYNAVALHLFEKAGFVKEVCRRQALNRDGRTWDMLHLGLLQSEWHPTEGD